MNYTDILIIGGGAAGICAALGARDACLTNGGSSAINLTLLEKNADIGSKIKISGGGRCNLTHSGSVSDILEKGFLRTKEARFLKPALHEFTNTDLLALLGKYGLTTKTRPDGCIFPATESSADVVRAFAAALRNVKLDLRYKEPVQSIAFQHGAFEVQTASGKIRAAILILATGGVSYPKTGSTGEGLRFAKNFGLAVNSPTPALAPLYFTLAPKEALIGVSLRQVRLFAKIGQNTFERTGDFIFTHKGISGPATLSLSRDIAEQFSGEKSPIFADFFPQKTDAELEKQFLDLLKSQPALLVKSFIKRLETAETALPNAMILEILHASELEESQKLSGLSKAARKNLLNALKQFELGLIKSIPLEKGEVSAGGVTLGDVNPKTMESRKIENLYICGELLDYAAEIGGFNLQAAFSTGWLAGKSAVGKFRKENDSKSGLS
ncbi:HI0933 family protein [Chloroherpeton thalassium ATCC 35110]|uniref:HI0933 family protein n=1 Tax=Chloroherpeton thalassium (strain ATCC 35110 / GB-78) TaxID=517418 RepID=B3QWY8_CHLT3|nr:aminoacetone oxidase family FAD-binding enzyme [Chloroherpeton thalassium]ACF13352.1 HI0933 family protein [Chloroherpeton thalassium ATCC 35110]